MHNSKKTSHHDLPSSKKLIKSTIFALVIAMVILITTILPAEYGVDPTGIGELLRLKKMGEIKASLEKEAKMETNKLQAEKIKSEIEMTKKKPVLKKKTEVNKKIKSKIFEYTFTQGEAIEIKLDMLKGSKVKYSWVTQNGLLNHDTHGEGVKGTKKFISYKKGRMVNTDAGVIKAAFDGSHGWFWRNRDKQKVSLKLKVTGDFKLMKRVK